MTDEAEGTGAPPDVLDSTSEAEEMYLINIAMAGEDGLAGPVPISRLAAALEVSSVSAHQMVRKLEERRLVTYTPYRGAQLTADGSAIAAGVLRRRRLWSVFLSEHLGLSPDSADETACDFEHVTSSAVAERLADFLGDPTVGPQGKPIPASDGPAERQGTALSTLAVGTTATVLTCDGPQTIRSFLTAEGIVAGATVTVLAAGSAGDRLVTTGATTVHLSGDVAAAVLVGESESA